MLEFHHTYYVIINYAHCLPVTVSVTVSVTGSVEETLSSFATSVIHSLQVCTDVVEYYVLGHPNST